MTTGISLKRNTSAVNDHAGPVHEMASLAPYVSDAAKRAFTTVRIGSITVVEAESGEIQSI